jgi:hypothetical protein
MVGQDGFADADRDRQDDDIVLFEVFQRQVARRIHDYPYAHLAPPGIVASVSIFGKLAENVRQVA